MYTVRYGDAWLHDPATDTLLTSLRVDAALNECGTCEMVLPATHPLRHGLALRDPSAPVRVLDGEAELFRGFVWETAETMLGDLEVTCKGELAWLGDTLVPPYSTVEGEAAMTAPSSPAALLEWYVERHNEAVDESKRFRVGVNDGALLDPNDHVYRASSQLPTTADEIRAKLVEPLGGFVSCRRERGARWLDWRAECSGDNAQVIDFGENLTDYLRTDSAEGMATVLRPVGGTPEGATSPVTIASVPDGEAAPGVAKGGERVWSEEGVERYGWVERVHESEALTVEGLLASAVRALAEASSPSVTVEARAVDLALLSDAWEPLVPGQYVRVRSRPHGIDEYLLVTAMELDCANPSESRYVLGEPLGGYTARLDELNAAIDSQADAVASISAEARAAAADAAEAVRAANDVPVVALASTNGTVFKRNLGVSTTIVATVYTPGGAISDAATLAERFGAGAYLEWGWRDVATDAPHVIVSDDPRLSLGGFALTVGPEDIDVQATITCSLNY